MAGQQKHKKGPGGGKPGGKPGGGPRKPQGKTLGKSPGRPAAKPAAKQQQQAGAKRKAPAPPEGVQKASLGKPSGDVDDFAFMLDEMEDYKPTDDVGAGGDLDGEQAQQQDAQQPAGSGDDEGAAAAAGGGDAAEGKQAKKRRKRGQKLSSMEFEASRQMARQIAECSAEEQADWLWASYQQHAAAASTLERGGLTDAGLVVMPAEGGLEERLKTLAAGGWWREAFCSRGGPKGSPTLLLVSPSAIGAVGLIKHCPQFNMACRVGKLFAKHFKVPEQEAVLRTQVMCIAAGTPNRLCKLADGGALKLGRLTHVVLDVCLDVKQRDLLAIPETRTDWWQFYERHLKARVDAGSVRLALVNSDQLGGGGGGGGS